MALRNVSTAPITQTESGQVVNSTCAGSVRFHIADISVIRHYTVANGVYNDCLDSMSGTYTGNTGTAAAGAAHSVEITLVETVDTVTVDFERLTDGTPENLGRDHHLQHDRTGRYFDLSRQRSLSQPIRRLTKLVDKRRRFPSMHDG